MRVTFGFPCREQIEMMAPARQLDTASAHVEANRGVTNMRTLSTSHCNYQQYFEHHPQNCVNLMIANLPELCFHP